jgi:TIR domain
MSSHPKIFVAHASQNEAFALRFAEDLDLCGASTWIAPRDLPASSAGNAEILENLANSDVFLPIVSGFYTQKSRSGMIQMEISLALATAHKNPDGFRILPVRVENCDIPRSLAPFQYVFNDEYVSMIRSICKSLNDTLPIGRFSRLDVLGFGLKGRRKVKTVLTNPRL